MMDKGSRTGQSLWDDIYTKNMTKKEKMGYPTQKPLALLLERIIKASTNEGDIVLDPFCGCATACVAAEKLNRRWIGIDVSVKAYELIQMRLVKEVDGFAEGQLGLDESKVNVNFTTTPPIRDAQNDLNEKWVYIISNEAFSNEYKVGIASNWKQRLNGYQTSDPNRSYKMEFKMRTPYYREIERHIHESFDNKHEWVRASLEDIKDEIRRKDKELKG